MGCSSARGPVSRQQEVKKAACWSPPPHLHPTLNSSLKIFPDAASRSLPAPLSSFFLLSFFIFFLPLLRKNVVDDHCLRNLRFQRLTHSTQRWGKTPSRRPKTRTPPKPTCPQLFLFTAPSSSSSLRPFPFSLCYHGDSHMGVLFLFVLQVQTLYYSPDHKLVDGGLVIDGHCEVFGGEEDHLQFVQVPSDS